MSSVTTILPEYPAIHIRLLLSINRCYCRSKGAITIFSGNSPKPNKPATIYLESATAIVVDSRAVIVEFYYSSVNLPF